MAQVPKNTRLIKQGKILKRLEILQKRSKKPEPRKIYPQASPSKILLRILVSIIISTVLIGIGILYCFVLKQVKPSGIHPYNIPGREFSRPYRPVDPNNIV
ncbi:hypothetical protein SNEBB_008205 [Seison nebaliae]|nr:hypothetical protein SNEBB_008205 [Seison nebaliae]